MIALLKTAERANNVSHINNYVFQRHVFAYKQVLQQPISGQQVLELGCGEGYGMEMIAPYTRSYLAVDKKKPEGVTFGGRAFFQQCLLPSLAGIADNSFDMIICFQVIEHIADDHRLLQEIKRVLVPGGKLLLTTPNRLTSLTRNPFHVREYTPAGIQALFAGHFSDCTVEGIYGNSAVMSYYEENKRSVAAITRYDFLNLQYRLPAWMLRVPYTLLNNLNRLSLLRKMNDVTAGIHYNDFYLDSLRGNCLDYFVTAVK